MALVASRGSAIRNEFCTLCDANYLNRALVLYRSLADVCSDFRLRIFCMDDESKRVLDKMALPHLVAIELAKIETYDPELRAVKPSRSQVEYDWTAIPVTCLYALEHEPELEMITFLGADLMFFNDPTPLFDELGEDSVLITHHRSSPRFEPWEVEGGTYNSQLVTFRHDERGLAPLRWWRERCIEWCYHRVEDGKYGDQKYLEEWPHRFPGVHVLEHPGGGVAPWNTGRYRLERRNGTLLVDGLPVIFHHYASLKLYQGITTLRRLGLVSTSYRFVDGPARFVWTTDPVYEISESEHQLLWAPYVCRVSEAIADIRAVEATFASGFVHLEPRQIAYEVARRVLPGPLRRPLSRVRRRMSGA